MSKNVTRTPRIRTDTAEFVSRISVQSGPLRGIRGKSFQFGCRAIRGFPCSLRGLTLAERIGDGLDDQCDVDRGAVRHAVRTRRLRGVAEIDVHQRHQLIDPNGARAVAVASTPSDLLNGKHAAAVRPG